MGSSMVIAVNMLCFTKENESAYLKRIVEALISRYPGDTFIILYEKYRPIEAFTNVQFFNTGLAPHGVERWNIWWYFKIRKVRKLYNPEVLINNGEVLLTPRDLPQILLYPDLSYLHDPKIHSKRFLRFSRIFRPAFIKKQSAIIVLSSFEKEVIIKHCAIDDSRIKVVVARADTNKILPDWDEKESIKEKYANGLEYFLYSGYISTTKNLLHLLKGFSTFKKRQKSSMQLLITGKEGKGFQEFKKVLELYKYRSDVHIIPFMDIEEHYQIHSAAYAMVFCYRFDNNINDLLTSLACQVPAIVPDKGTLHEVGRDGVLTYEAGNIADLGAKMMLLFKDEKHRKKIIESAGNWLLEADYDKGIDKIWETIESVSQT